ncbi:MAG: redoxin domain-containing protein [Pirellulales bacterium]|nr:redoxin domain-containing protein [Pirellulales bacterium]
MPVCTSACCGMIARVAILAVGLESMLLATQRSSAADQPIVGRPINSFTLPDVHGREQTLAALRGDGPLVVLFVGVECPLVGQYMPRIVELAAAYAKQGVRFVAIDANRQDSLAELVAFGQRHKLELPILKDPSGEVARQFGATRTPEAFVVDAAGRVRYHGRIDDQYGVGFLRPQPTRRDLALALDDLLAGREPAVAETPAAGCLIGQTRIASASDSSKPSTADAITYTKHIAPILQQRCVECHRAGEVAPFALTEYEEVAGWAETIREVVNAGRMPPWFASPEYGEFHNAGHMTDEEKQLIDAWVDAGAPQGDPRDLPPPRTFTDGWGMPEPDQIIRMSDKPFHVPAEGVLDYQYYEVDPGWKEDKWIIGSEARPGARSVVHHILVFIKRPNKIYLPLLPGELISAYAPGMKPTVSESSDMAMLAPAGSKIVFQVHYTPNGTPQDDISYLGVKFCDVSQVKYEVSAGMAINLSFRIPPGDPDYKVTASYRFRRDAMLMGVNPHMHLRGKAFRYEALYPDGTREILMDCPKFDFNWQIGYQYLEPKRMPAGTRIFCTAHYDNSSGNVSNPDPTRSVVFGEQTWDEMMIGWFFAAEARKK